MFDGFISNFIFTNGTNVIICDYYIRPMSRFNVKLFFLYLFPDLIVRKQDDGETDKSE